MRVSDLYRGLLLLYPADFRKQFSEEMISVFEQRAGECAANREPVAFAFFVMEFFGIVKGACIMWLAKVLPANRKPSRPEAAAATVGPMTISELTEQRDAAIKDMVASIAEHDFINARRYSYEEVRLKRLLQDLEDGISVTGSRTA